jgi:hypothetical protein
VRVRGHAHRVNAPFAAFRAASVQSHLAGQHLVKEPTGCDGTRRFS